GEILNTVCSISGVILARSSSGTLQPSRIRSSSAMNALRGRPPWPLAGPWPRRGSWPDAKARPLPCCPPPADFPVRLADLSGGSALTKQRLPYAHARETHHRPNLNRGPERGSPPAVGAAAIEA